MKEKQQINKLKIISIEVQTIPHMQNIISKLQK